jgi:alpha-beta hydrolase superfamily lysophospholipase
LAADLGQRQGDLTSRDGTRLFWQSWPVPQPKATVAVVHGLGEHSGRYARLAAALNARGFGCCAVDLRGMGRSEGRRGHIDHWERWIEDSAAFYRLASERSGGVEVVPLGHSFGGVVVATAVLSGAMRPGRFVLSNPAFRPAVRVPGWKRLLGRATGRMAPRLTMGNEVDPALISRDPVVVAEYRADPLVHDRISSRLFTEWLGATEMAMRQAPDLTVPVLLIVSGDDRIIDAAGTLEFASRVGKVAAVRRYAARYHEPFNDLGGDEVFASLAAWLDGAAECE